MTPEQAVMPTQDMKISGFIGTTDVKYITLYPDSPPFCNAIVGGIHVDSGPEKLCLKKVLK